MGTVDKGLYKVIRGLDERMHKYYITPRLEKDKRKFLPMNDFDIAHVIMLKEQNIIKTEDTHNILKALIEIQEMGIEKFPFDSKMDIFMNRESFIMKAIGENIGGKIHTGRSRSDVAGVADRIVTRTDLLLVMENILKLINSSIRLTEENIETVMPSYTQLQHAQPTTFAHYLLSFIYPFIRDFERFEIAFLRTNVSPAGAAILAGTSFPINRERIADLLGFDGLCMNTRDATMNYDYMLDGLYASAVLMCDLARLAEDLEIWCSLEFKMIDLADSFCGTSSIMPQKRNPHPLQLIRGECGLAFGQLMGALSVLKAPSEEVIEFYNIPILSHETLTRVKEMLEISEGMLSTIILHKETMMERAAMYWAQATDLADIIVREKGLDFRTTHHIVARLVKMNMEAKKRPQDVTTDMLDIAAKEIIGESLGLSEKSLRQAVDPLEGARGRKVPGGPAPERVREQISECRELLNAMRERYIKYTEKINVAAENLRKTIENIIQT